MVEFIPVIFRCLVIIIEERRLIMDLVPIVLVSILLVMVTAARGTEDIHITMVPAIPPITTVLIHLLLIPLLIFLLETISLHQGQAIAHTMRQWSIPVVIMAPLQGMRMAAVLV